MSQVQGGRTAKGGVIKLITDRLFTSALSPRALPGRDFCGSIVARLFVAG